MNKCDSLGERVNFALSECWVVTNLGLHIQELLASARGGAHIAHRSSNGSDTYYSNAGSAASLYTRSA